jgi:hypothetical protein
VGIDLSARGFVLTDVRNATYDMFGFDPSSGHVAFAAEVELK